MFREVLFKRDYETEVKAKKQNQGGLPDLRGKEHIQYHYLPCSAGG